MDDSDAETILLTLSDPGNASIGTPSVATVNLTSNDVAGTIQFERDLQS